MSGKKTNVRAGGQPAAQVVPGAQTPVSEPITKKDQIWIAAYAVLLFLAMTVQTGAMTLFLTVLALVLSVGKGPLKRFRACFCVPVIGLLAFALMNGLAAIYSDFGGYAVSEYYKFLAAFAMAVILLARFEKKHVRGLLWGLAGVAAVISLLCIDVGSFGKLFDLFARVMGSLGADYSGVLENSQGIRVNGIYNDPNVSGSILALGSLVSLYLVNSEKILWKRALASFLLGVSAMGFFLSMSRGAILCFALALLVWLIAAGKGNRLSLFFLMFFSAVVVVALSIPVASGIGVASVLPDLLTLFSGLLIFALDWLLGSRLVLALEGRGKAIAIAILLLAGLCVGYAVTAMAVTGPYIFDENGYMSWIIKLEPGTYTLSGEWDESLRANVWSQSEMDMLRRTGGGTSLYDGPLEDVSFTLTGDEFRVSLLVWGENGQTVRELTFSDGTKVALGHPLLPSFLANRLQDDLLTSNSFLQRLEFFRDGWKLFLKAPLIGSGLGSTEGLLTSVQSYYYESKFIHNHILQVMDEMGLLGLAGFLALLGGSLWLPLEQRRQERDGLAAVLLACWVMINTHSLMEINFSVRAFQCFAYPLLLMPVVFYGKPLAQKAVKVCGLAMAGFVWVYLAVFGGLLAGHRMVQQAAANFVPGSAYELMHTMETYVGRDVFDHEQYQLNYVGNAALLDDGSYDKNTEKYVKALRSSGTYTACSGLARYYYLPRGQWEELFACSREGIAQEASSKDSWNLQCNFYRNEVLPAMGAENFSVFLDGVLDTKCYLETYSQGRLEEIELTEENAAFLNTVSSVRENNLPDEVAYQLLTQMYAPAETLEG